MPVPTLPNGWTVITTTRRRGISKGNRDKTYYSPTFERFRSMAAVRRYLDTLEVPLPVLEGKEEIEENKDVEHKDAEPNEEVVNEEEIVVAEDNLVVVQNEEQEVVIVNIEAAASAHDLMVEQDKQGRDVIVIDSSSDEDDNDSSPDDLWL